jgi:hypothetical protein
MVEVPDSLGGGWIPTGWGKDGYREKGKVEPV